MLRLALRSVRAHPARFLMSLLAVAIAASFMTGTLALRTMLDNTFEGIIEQENYDVLLRGVGEDADGTGPVLRNTIEMTLAYEVEALDEVARAIVSSSGPAVLVGADGTAVQSTMAPSFAMAHSHINHFWPVVEGRLPQGREEIALEVATLEFSGLAVGDQTHLVIGGEVWDVQVVGVLEPDAPLAGATIVLIDPEVAREVFNFDGRTSGIAVYAAEGVSIDEVLVAVAPLLADAATPVEAVDVETVRAETRAEVQTALGFVTTLLMVFVVLALFIGAFIISNSFAMSVRVRMREFAMLRSIGASPQQVFTSVLVQAVMVGLLGAALGIAGGVGLVHIVDAVLAGMGMELAGDLPLTAATIISVLVVGVTVSVVAAALAARRAAFVPPVEAMRDEVTVRDQSRRIRLITGSVLAAGGVVLLVAAGVSPDADWSLTALGGGAAGLISGALLTAPWLAKTVVGVLAAPAAWLLRPLGGLARGNVTRNPKRTAATSGALMIGMALVSAASVLATSAQASIGTIVDEEIRADFVLRVGTGAVGGFLPTGAIENLVALPIAARVDTPWFSQALVDAGDTTNSTWVAGVEPDAFGETIVFPMHGGDATVLDQRKALVEQGAAEDWGVSVGDIITLRGDGTTVPVIVGAIFESVAFGLTPVMVSQELLNEVTPPLRQITDVVFVTGAPGVYLEDLRAALAAAVSPYFIVTVFDSEEFADSISAQFDAILAIFYALLGLSIAIAVLGIINTLAMSVIERTREIGLLRAVGLGRLQLASTITIESVLTAVFGTVLGLAIGVGISAVFPRVMQDMGLRYLAIPWVSLVVMLVLAVVVGAFAALWPAGRASRLKVLDAIAHQ